MFDFNFLGHFMSCILFVDSHKMDDSESFFMDWMDFV